MNNDLEQFSEERLKEIANFAMAGAIEVVELARIALSVKQAKPVAWMTWHQGFRAPDDCEDYLNAYTYKTEEKSVDGSDAFPVYTTPQPAHTGHEVTLDYLHGHRDGLEWAARTAEACNPLTSDWLYEEREDLAAAIRKGPEMPPAHAEQLIPDGWKLVPIEPTEDMLKAGCRFASEHNTKGLWRQILQFAPKPESD